MSPGIYYIEEPELKDGRLTASVLNSGGADSGVMIVGIYDKELQILKRVLIYKIEPGAQRIINEELILNQDETAKAMLWNEKLAPAAAAVVLE